MLFGTFKFGTRRFGISHKAYLNPKKSIDGVCIAMMVRGSIAKRYIFQRSHGGYQRKAWKPPYDPNSAGQQSQRSKFTDAVAWAKGLSEGEKNVYKTLVAVPSRLPGYPHSSFSGRSWFNWAISDYLVSH